VPHLSESLLIGIERRQFVESDVNKFAKIIDALFALISNAFPRADARGQLRRACAALASPEVVSNAYVHWLLTGAHREALPLALRPEHYARIRSNLHRLEWRCQRLEACLATLPSRSIDCFNLSNVFEYLGEPACTAVLRDVARVGRPGARVLYWNLFVERERPASLAALLAPRSRAARDLHARSGAFFYRRLVIEQVTA